MSNKRTSDALIEKLTILTDNGQIEFNRKELEQMFRQKEVIINAKDTFSLNGKIYDYNR